MGGVETGQAGETVERGKREVGADRHGREDTEPLAVLGDHADARGQGVARRGDPHRPAVQADLARVGGTQPEEGFGDFRATCAHQASEAEHLAATQRKGDGPVRRFAGESRDLQDDVARLADDGRENLGELATDHVGDEGVRREFRRGGRAHQAAVPQHRHAVGEPEHLVHLVRRVDDGDAAATQHVDRLEQGGYLVVGERGRGLVQQEHVRLAGQGLGDLDDLTLGDGEPAHGLAGIKTTIELAEPLGGLAVQFGAVDPAERVDGLQTEQQVLRDVEVGDRHELLVDHRDALCEGVLRGGEAHGLAAQGDRAPVGRLQAGEDLHQRGLARAVLAHERVHLARPELHRDILQGRQAPEGLGELADGQHAVTSRSARRRGLPAARRSMDESRVGDTGTPRPPTGSAAYPPSAGSPGRTLSRGNGSCG